MTSQQAVERRINFLQEQLNSLEHYLPETYQFLMAELDAQHRELMEHKIKDFYTTQSNERQDQINSPGDQTQSQESDHRNL